MSHQQWEAIERTLAGAPRRTRELMDRILQSLQAESPAPDCALLGTATPWPGFARS